jgi:HSP20 family protein
MLTKASPPVNVIETDTAYFLEISVPGYQKMNLSVKLEDEVLEVRGSGMNKPYRNVVRTLRSEFNCHAFTRLFLVPGDVKEVIAWFDGGVLSIQLLKSKDPSHLKDKEVLIQ